MPIVYRIMLNDNDRPVVGTGPNMLGARVPVDIVPDNDENRTVHPNQGTKGGISVNKNWKRLPPAMIPERLIDKHPTAVGPSEYTVFRYESGDLETGPLPSTVDLFLRWGKKYHGTIEPISSMPLDQYQTSLAATRERWCNAESEL